MSENLFKRLIALAASQGYSLVLYNLDTKGYILDSKIFPQVVGKSRFYLELCLIHRWLEEEKNIFVQVKSASDLLYIATTRDRRDPKEKIKTLPSRDSYVEALYSGVKEVLDNKC